MTLADRVLVRRAGRIEQVGTPLELYNEPANRFVAGFIGAPPMNFLKAQVVSVADGSATLSLAVGQQVQLLVGTAGPVQGQALTGGVRPPNRSGTGARSCSKVQVRRGRSGERSAGEKGV